MLLLALVFALPAIARSVAHPRRAPSLLRRQSPCEPLCESSSDITVLSQFQQCETRASEDTCTCQYAFSLSATCLACVLEISDLTLSVLQQYCAEYSSLLGATPTLEAGATSGTSPAAGTTPGAGFAAGQVGITLPTVGAVQATLTSGSAGAGQTVAPSGAQPGAGASACLATCGDAGDVAAVESVSACASTGYTCICTASRSISTPCMTCLLNAQNLSLSEYNTICASQGGNANGLPAGSNSTSGSSSSSTGTGSGSATLPGASAPPGFGSGSSSLRARGWTLGGVLLMVTVIVTLLG
ncbi:hypothetical protein CALCODRAFT_515284 [Calocera cornea HHB12733]|uniref:Extracellular membrane protein CFEM domain-containing protein n=1 Tax=Calocera cornea HHB12733 TaxID=1353952 RepID=A0A165IKP4_9BASI|nr:hypothetical protein CALCODRAFT_515284 [Calocera cornea HHB12733]